MFVNKEWQGDMEVGKTRRDQAHEGRQADPCSGQRSQGLATPQSGGSPMTGNRKAHRRIDKLVEKAIDAYALGGCPFCGSAPEDFAPYPVGTDRLGQTIACCTTCADGRIVSISGYGVKTPDDEGTQWSMHDKAFFELYPERRLHVREPWGQEAAILTKMVAVPIGSVPCNAMLVVQLEPGVRVRSLCPFPDPEEADQAGDEAIAAQTGQSVAQLLAKTKSELRTRLARGSVLNEMELGMAWAASLNGTPRRAYTPSSRTQKRSSPPLASRQRRRASKLKRVQ